MYVSQTAAKRLFCFSLFCTLSLSLRGGIGRRGICGSCLLYSGEKYKEAAFGGSEVYGQPAGARQGCVGVHLPASRRERHRLEGDPSRHHERELHQ